MRILIIGAGPGGYETAAEAAKRGFEVTLVAEGPFGGTCLNEGCIPTKTLSHFRGTLADAQVRKTAVVDQLRAGIASLMSNKLITVVPGHAAFKDAKTVVVDGNEYTADKIIIATGSVPAVLPVPGADRPFVLDSTGILELEEVPAHLCVIGGGVIGLEFASIFRKFGSEVTVVEYAKEVLPNFDSDLAKRLRLALKARGIAIETGACVTEMSVGDSVTGGGVGSERVQSSWSGISGGTSVGISVGTAVGISVGASVGTAVASSVGISGGRAIGMSVGTAVGVSTGTTIGIRVGSSVGAWVGGSFFSGSAVGAWVSGAGTVPAVLKSRQEL